MTARTGVNWWPEALQAVAGSPEQLADFAYVVLEELVDHRVVLMAWSWPKADNAGHLFWSSRDEARPLVAIVDQDRLRAQLYRPSRLQRSPRLGDVYAASRLGPGWGDAKPVTDVRTLFDGPLYDISADAREAAKLAYYGAVATVRRSRTTDRDDAALLSRAAEHRSRLRAKELRLAAQPTSGGDRR